MSYPTPTYYSHLVAERARKHYNEMVFGKFGGETDPKLKEVAIKKEIEQAQSIPMYFV